MRQSLKVKSEVQGTITLGKQEFIYVITRKKIKNLYFRVKKDLKIHVSCHNLVSNVTVKKLLLANASAITKLYNQAQRQQVKGLYYLGNPLTFIFKDTFPYIENDNIYGRTNDECAQFIYDRALAVFETRLTQIKHQFFDLPNFTLKARKMTSKWGVCNKSSMGITLNTELITKDVHLIDYVIIHELCHFKYMDHSPAYWRYVSQFCPYYKQMRKELKD